jgi:beta-glucosidase
MPSNEVTDMGWEVYPRGIFEILARVHFDYRFPAYFITENGAAYPDVVTPSGTVPDKPRIRYLKEHLRELQRAISIGIPVLGYFIWSLLDNFEWAYGYSKRFGIVYVDYKTLRRIPKESAYWYAKVIANNGIEVE